MKKYLIFNVGELDKVNFNQVEQTSAESVRKSLDGTLTFVKWSGDDPSFISDLTTKQGPYTYEEVINILRTPQWTNSTPTY
jgi:hypothetical protein